MLTAADHWGSVRVTRSRRKDAALPNSDSLIPCDRYPQIPAPICQSAEGGEV